MVALAADPQVALLTAYVAAPSTRIAVRSSVRSYGAHVKSGSTRTWLGMLSTAFLFSAPNKTGKREARGEYKGRISVRLLVFTASVPFPSSSLHHAFLHHSRRSAPRHGPWRRHRRTKTQAVWRLVMPVPAWRFISPLRLSHHPASRGLRPRCE